jgi:hypothetical protein
VTGKKVIARIRGGLGNQLFCYAAARRLAVVNDAELVLDNTTGFVRDREYGRKYMLNHFRLPVRIATAAERLEPFERYRRGAMKWIARAQRYERRRYLEEEKHDFDERLLRVRIRGTLYLDGLWQSEEYFEDIEQTIREDLSMISPEDEASHQTATAISQCEAVALHVRWFDPPAGNGARNTRAGYYERAMSVIEKRIASPHYFVFSDDPVAARETIALPYDRVTFVRQSGGDQAVYSDLWLMTKCRHFITANSTFSWWGAWLAPREEKIVVGPKEYHGSGRWHFRGLIPV